MDSFECFFKSQRARMKKKCQKTFVGEKKCFFAHIFIYFQVFSSIFMYLHVFSSIFNKNNEKNNNKKIKTIFVIISFFQGKLQTKKK
jgi:hypothetical protein